MNYMCKACGFTADRAAVDRHTEIVNKIDDLMAKHLVTTGISVFVTMTPQIRESLRSHFIIRKEQLGYYAFRKKNINARHEHDNRTGDNVSDFDGR